MICDRKGVIALPLPQRRAVLGLPKVRGMEKLDISTSGNQIFMLYTVIKSLLTNQFIQTSFS